MNLLTIIYYSLTFVILLLIFKKTKTVMEIVDQLKKDVAALLASNEKAVALIKDIKTRLDAGITAEDLDALKELSASIEESTAEVDASVAANTPADETGTDNTSGAQQG